MNKFNLEKKINNLFLEKKYDELINIADKYTTQNKRPPSLANIIGISKILKTNRTKEDVISSLALFKETFINGGKSVHAMNGLVHLISISLQFVKKYPELSFFLRESEEYYIKSEKNFHTYDKFLYSGVYLFSHLLDFEKQDEILKKLFNTEKKTPFVISLYLYNKNYIRTFSQKDHYEITKNNSMYFPKHKVKKLLKSSFDTASKINLGFVSKDFQTNHPIYFFLKHLIRQLDRKKFEVSLFSFAKKNFADKSQNDLRKFADKWYDLNNFTNQESINLFQKNRIKILIDLMGYTAPDRIEIFNSRISPIQISWLAYCNTLGFKTIDYIIADKKLILENEEKYYSEKILKLPDIWNTHSGFQYKRCFNPLPCKKNNIFTFGSLNNFHKITDETISVWSEILKKNSNSNLILKSSVFCDKKNLYKKFQEKGVIKQVKFFERINFKDKEQHLKLYNQIDLALDTFPYNGVTTTFEAFWMNVPVLTLKGYNFNSRCGESIISNSSFEYLIADNKKDYINKAIYLSQNTKSLNKLRKNIYQSILSSPLFDTKKYVENFSKTLIKINEGAKF